MGKTFVKVTAVHDIDGKTKPLALVWTNGKQYEIDRVTDARMAPSMKGAGWGCGIHAGLWGKKFICLRMRDDGFWRGKIQVTQTHLPIIPNFTNV